MENFRFGMVGAGSIAAKFAETCRGIEGVEAAAIASRSMEKARDFAQAHDVHKAYGSYQELYEDPEIDAIYIATPHSSHKSCALEAIAQGKHILCEKPMTTNYDDSKAIFDAAAEKQVFAMEALWTRFLPATIRAKQWVGEGKIGEIRHITASFGFCSGAGTESRLMNPALAGGALYDVGVYGIGFMLDFMQGKQLCESAGFCTRLATGVDGLDCMLFRFQDGALAQITGAISCYTEHWGFIYGSEGYIKLGPNFFAPQKAQLYLGRELAEEYEQPFTSGFEYEIAHMVSCVRKGKLISSRIPPEDTLACAKIFDRFAKEWGI